MRKGRSSRRSRVSRPLIGGKAPSSTTDLVVVDSRMPSVVVGIRASEPPSEGPNTEKPRADIEAKGGGSSEAPAGAPDFSKTLVDSPLAAPGSGPPSAALPVDPLQALETLERPHTLPPATRPTENVQREPKRRHFAQTHASFASTMAFGSAEAEGEETPKEREKEDRAKLFASTIAFGSAADAEASITRDELEDEREKAERDSAPSLEQTLPLAMPPEAEATEEQKRSDREARSEPKAKAKSGRDSDKRVGRKTELGGLGLREDESEVHEKFFSEGDLARHLHAPAALDSEPAITVQDKVKRKAEPDVVERRERFVGYVKWAVGAAAVVCLAAVVREGVIAKSGTAARSDLSERPAMKAADPAAAPVRPDPLPTTAPPGATESSAGSASAPLASAEPAAALAPSATAAPAPSSASASSEKAPADPPSGDAKEEKAKARSSLERRKLAEAIEEGERSVAIDPTDGESWLILGAAYQEKGNLAEARRAYSSCVKEAKTGPRNECMKMLR